MVICFECSLLNWDSVKVILYNNMECIKIILYYKLNENCYNTCNEYNPLVIWMIYN